MDQANTYTPRRLGLLPVDALKQLLQFHLKRLVLCALVEFAEEISAGAKGVVAKREGREAEILVVC